MSVDYYSYIWTQDPIVAGFIAESGSAANMGGAATNLSAGWYIISQKIGCGGSELGEKTLECMQTKPWKAIADQVPRRGVTPNTGSGGFGPIIDEKLVFSDYPARRATGRFIPAPMLVGNTNNEAGFYVLLARAIGQTLPQASTSLLGGMSSSCGPHSAAIARTNEAVPAWRYLYQGEYPNQDIGVPGGAWHTAEIGIAFGTSEWASRIPDSPEEKIMGDKMRKAWTGFAKDPSHGLEKLGWPVYDQKNPSVVKIGGKNSPDITFEVDSKSDGVCPK
jgi:cholinesterase